MKNLVIAAILGFAAAGSAQAMTTSSPLSHSELREVRELLPRADFSALTASQTSRIQLLLNERRISNDIDRRSIVRNILKQ